MEQLALDPLVVARWQFGITTVYHYFFVPLTIGLATITAILETAWVRTGKEKYFRATKFWGKLFLINFAMGVVTGIVQEFQFGMNWSDYSRFVGDVFGAPLAIEALLAFFLESTFLGLWIFGWDKLPKRLHAATIWCAAIGTMLSAYFILAANSWMQHPVGYTYNPETGRAELHDFGAMLFQDTAYNAAFHTLSAAFLTTGAFVVGVASWHLMRRRHTAVMRSSLRLGLAVVVVAGSLTAISGDSFGKVMFQQQPMKMAAAEALWETSAPAPFSVFAYGNVQEGHNEVALEIPGLLSFLAHSDFSTEVPGINDLNEQYQELYGPGDYRPNIAVAYWGFRLMIGLGMTSFAVGVAGLWLTRRRLWRDPATIAAAGRHDDVDHDDASAADLWLTRRHRLAAGTALNRWGWRIPVLTLALPLFANSAGWIFTEMGRQPWLVFGLLRTEDGVSPSVSTATVLTSLIVFTTLYAVLAVIEVRLLLKYAKAGPTQERPPAKDPVLLQRRRGNGGQGGGTGGGGTGADGDPDTETDADADADRPMVFAY
ncbi:cytochrome ubiquinol oxidase subunit I [Allostreptomyces psammosilenae]|uniref:Cytochrome d ubiquinol oxidase subunit I n=1 Tax=Allostreptomyces psammosilenae TaxID=1892865 RepID=A0A852ZU91_9ACTN|nr:cytochrome ubiquinol oxidase subunit I [Allostreptomyces psammosilenae]NYI05455.1 cytochrome d ubiquinol oxidase subunit I [Allostreptomyces psammosilenae]